jgi:hypothetical protein
MALAAARQAQRVAMYEQVWSSHRQGWTLDVIPQHVGLSRRIVQRYLQSPTLTRVFRANMGWWRCMSDACARPKG